MEMLINKRYLKIPVKHAGEPFHFVLSVDGKAEYFFDAVYTRENADAVYYADLRDYLGKAVALIAPEDFTAEFADEMTPLTDAENLLCPAVHFTAERGWINDPNGLCFYNGEYHLFYQHNPFGRLWGNMHWGHAVSRDLFHWEHREEALFQDMQGLMFSGSAVVDYDNVSGLKDGGDAPLLFFYTCAGKAKTTQNLAYSTDGGKTLKKYGVLIEQHVPGNRDPKVIYDAERSRWLMALYFEERTYGIFTSKDLLHWELQQKFDLPGDDECPDLYPLTADDGRTLWVYSGAHDMYFVGEFDENGLYQPVQSAGQLSYGSVSYAAQTYFVEAGKPVIRFAWNRSDIPGAPFNGSMCTPMEMTLKKRGGRYYLCALPVEGLEELISNEMERFDLITAKHTIPLNKKACRIDVLAPSGAFQCSLYGLEIRVDKSGVTCGEAFLPALEGESMQLTVITDAVSTELYLNGTAFSAIPHVQDAEKAEFALWADKPVHIETLRVAELDL